jgi:hypothetical protein
MAERKKAARKQAKADKPAEAAVLSQKTAGRIENIEPHKWKPGCESPNPGGRPKKLITLVSDALREELARVNEEAGTTGAQEIARVLVQEALVGKSRVTAIAEIRDTTEGRPSQAVKIEGSLTIGAEERRKRITELHARLTGKGE